MAFHGTCPQCGFSTYKQKNPMKELKSLYGQRNEKAKNALAKVSEKIQKHIPSDKSLEAKLKFMYKVTKVDDASFVKGCEAYLNSIYWQQGKGWNYLAAIINNVGQNSDAVAFAERKRIGIGPPKKELKND